MKSAIPEKNPPTASRNPPDSSSSSSTYSACSIGSGLISSFKLIENTASEDWMDVISPSDSGNSSSLRSSPIMLFFAVSESPLSQVSLSMLSALLIGATPATEDSVSAIAMSTAKPFFILSFITSSNLPFQANKKGESPSALPNQSSAHAAISFMISSYWVRSTSCFSSLPPGGATPRPSIAGKAICSVTPALLNTTELITFSISS